MQLRSWHDFVQVDGNGQITGVEYFDWESAFGVAHGSESHSGDEVQSHATGPTYNGSLSNENNGDMIAVTLIAGQTYTWSYRGAATGGISDPWLKLIGTDGVTVITEDDDGGLGRTSQITYTATADGTYYLNATSWYQVDPTAPAYQDNGNYTIVQWSPEAGHDAGNSLATTATISVGTNYNYFEAAGDSDYYAITLTAGEFYTFTFNGGVASEPVDPGESIAAMVLYNSSGTAVTSFLYSSSGETGISYYAAQSGTFYLRADPISNFFGGTPMTGGYTIDVRAQNLEDMDPLDTLNWDNAANIPTVDVDGVPTAYVYFAAAGENFGEKAPNGSPMVTYGWNAREQAAVMEALAQYTPITGINYVVTTDVTQATFRMLTTANQPGTPGNYGAYAIPQDPAYGDRKGILVFNVNSGGWDKPGVSNQNLPGDQVSLDQGGFSFAVILHEFGHSHGVAHPHDTGGGSTVMPGVTSSTGSLGVYNMNQGIYTVMSYNDAWQLHPDGPSSFSIAGIDNGWSGTLSALDIAVLQARYGYHDNNTGNNVYTLSDVADDAFYQTIWDTDGTDTIAYGGALNAQIDLTAATLDYSPTGGGVVSFLYNPQPLGPASTLIKGGYTIANGVTIENATGGSGNDILLGNSVANTLTGNDGDDFLMGRGGNDILLGGSGVDTITGGDGIDVATLGAGNDKFVAEVTATKSNLKTGSMSVDIITDFDAAGDDVIDLTDLGTMIWRGTNANKNAGDLSYKTYTSVTGAENALGFDIDGQPGAGGVSGPVTVVYGNTDGGKPDFAIILLNTTSVDASDFLFATPSAMMASGGGGDYLIA